MCVAMRAGRQMIRTQPFGSGSAQRSTYHSRRSTRQVAYAGRARRNDRISSRLGQASLRWLQERQNELWIGRRDAPNATLLKDPSLVGDAARAYTHLPGGHQEGWADAFCNVMRDIYGFIAAGRRMSDRRPPAFATFEDGYHSACLVDAVLESHRRGAVWTAPRTFAGIA